MTAFLLVACILSIAPCGLFLLNLNLYRRTDRMVGRKHRSSPEGQPQSQQSAIADEPREDSVSVLIPARNEERNIRDAISAVLANRDLDLEIIVLDDHSTDGTAKIVSEMARGDFRLRLESAPLLPGGWCGKQHACAVLAQHAKHSYLVFLDADVRLSADALGRMVGFVREADVALASGVPFQKLGTLSELLLLPLIHFVLLAFLPIHRMRQTTAPGCSAGCGQLFIARRDAYQACGGHANIRDSLHDGIQLPRLFRKAGFRTDLFDATDLATCRMFNGNGEVWRGLARNATEGLAAPKMILPMTIFLLGGQVLPFFLLTPAFSLSQEQFLLALLAVLFALLPRLIATRRFRQPVLSALLHPLGVIGLLCIQWYAFLSSFLGRPRQWRGRVYGAAPSPIKSRPFRIHS
jgi:glycosyltransferase involved in cell wall biosynthesis